MVPSSNSIALLLQFRAKFPKIHLHFVEAQVILGVAACDPHIPNAVIHVIPLKYNNTKGPTNNSHTLGKKFQFRLFVSDDMYFLCIIRATRKNEADAGFQVCMLNRPLSVLWRN